MCVVQYVFNHCPLLRILPFIKWLWLTISCSEFISIGFCANRCQQLDKYNCLPIQINGHFPFKREHEMQWVSLMIWVLFIAFISLNRHRKCIRMQRGTRNYLAFNTELRNSIERKSNRINYRIDYCYCIVHHAPCTIHYVCIIPFGYTGRGIWSQVFRYLLLNSSSQREQRSKGGLGRGGKETEPQLNIARVYKMYKTLYQ